MARISSFRSEGDHTLTLWLGAETAEDRRFLTRIINAFADEINSQIAEDKWDFEEIAATGAAIIELRDEAQAKEEEAEDEAL